MADELKPCPFYVSAKFADERLDSDRILLKQRGEYVPYVREHTGTMDRDKYGYWVCSECGETLPAWVDKYPANYCPYCGAKVVEP